ncbi:hypothetical protein [Chamaesiphon minutus]|uniref:Uncharacterized protein n=1 Tax=Chamaesiphon minutus (strain ATCC 27169 / PCC 6605) TaxID=1173020 RepID=K9UKG2_CHAP6|nr:hypothetical protein [Chamaesiphon minutus]AFY95153.1 hypothetical protein Cha6605_4210 [Chamaesiphon minutus PCC 6605]
MMKNNADPVGTLSIGNVVTMATTLYKSNFKRYLQVSARATAWVVAIVAASIGLLFVGGVMYGFTKSWLAAIPVVLGWVAATFYFLAKYSTDRAIICRLAYQELANAPETVAVATQNLLPRMWGFLRLSWLVSLYLFVVALVSYIGVIIVIFMAAAILSILKVPTANLAVSFIIGLLAIVLILLWFALLIRYYAYWFVSELPMAIESTTSASYSISRSRQLSGVVANKVAAIIAVGFLVTLPITSMGNVPSFIGQIMTTSQVGSIDPSTQAIGSLLMLGGFILSLLGELIIMPFWQAIKAIVYYDLRNRREGIDLSI